MRPHDAFNPRTDVSASQLMRHTTAPLRRWKFATITSSRYMIYVIHNRISLSFTYQLCWEHSFFSFLVLYTCNILCDVRMHSTRINIAWYPHRTSHKVVIEAFQGLSWLSHLLTIQVCCSKHFLKTLTYLLVWYSEQTLLLQIQVQEREHNYLKNYRSSYNRIYFQYFKPVTLQDSLTFLLNFSIDLVDEPKSESGNWWQRRKLLQSEELLLQFIHCFLY